MPVRPRAVFVLAIAVTALGCERADPRPPVVDTPAQAQAQPEADAPPAWTGEWASGFGDILLVPSDTDNTAILVYPEAIAEAAAAGPVDLISAGGEVSARGVAITGLDSLECGGAPVVRLSSATFGTWSIGVRATRGLLRGDSIEALPRRDSAQLVMRLARMASGIEADEATRFTGLPFSVVRARAWTIGQTRIVAAHLARKLPQEASPLEEHTFVIAERTVSSDSLALRYSQRSEGTEETAEHFEVLSAVSGPTTLLLVARDNTTGTRYEILERSPAGVWRVRWARPLSC